MHMYSEFPSKLYTFKRRAIECKTPAITFKKHFQSSWSWEYMLTKLAISSFIFIFFIALASQVTASEYKGWGLNSPYNNLYKPSERTSFKGEVIEILDIAPLPDMATGTGLLVRKRGSKDPIIVHLGPKSFIDLSVIRLTPGQRITIKGIHAKIGGQQFVMASKIKKSEYLEIKIRHTSTGFPMWLHTDEELIELIREN